VSLNAVHIDPRGGLRKAALLHREGIPQNEISPGTAALRTSRFATWIAEDLSNRKPGSEKPRETAK